MGNAQSLPHASPVRSTPVLGSPAPVKPTVTVTAEGGRTVAFAVSGFDPACPGYRVVEVRQPGEKGRAHVTTVVARFHHDLVDYLTHGTLALEDGSAVRVSDNFTGRSDTDSLVNTVHGCTDLERRLNMMLHVVATATA